MTAKTKSIHASAQTSEVGAPPAEPRAGALLEALPAAVYATDHKGRLIFYNAAAADVWGLRPRLGDEMWCSSWRLSGVDGKPLAHAHEIDAAYSDQQRLLPGVEATAKQANGTSAAFIVHRAHLKGVSGKTTGGINLLIDITRRKAAEDALLEQEARHQLMMRESDHRNSNLLATVQALARMTQADTIPAFVEAFTGRIFSIARAHALLAESRWTGAALRKLVDDELAPYRSTSDRIHIIGEDLQLGAEAGQVIAMVIHELTTNAAKYGALSAPDGNLTIAWHRSKDGDLVLLWTEKCPQQCTAPPRKGFGMKLIGHSIEGQLSGRTNFEWLPNGLACTIVIPKDKVELPCQPRP